jgi:phosphopantetheinyl transferase
VKFGNMPIFFQQDIDANTRLAIWKIEEGEEFFSRNVPLQQNITHPHKRLQHLAGRYLLQWLYPGFPIELIRIADTKKPFLEDEAYHFSISHCGDYAAVIVSTTNRVGIDIEMPSEKVKKIEGKFLHRDESVMLRKWSADNHLEYSTILWSAKEAMFKWWGLGKVDFSEMLRLHTHHPDEEGWLDGKFSRDGIHVAFPVHYKMFKGLMMAWVVTETSNVKRET